MTFISYAQNFEDIMLWRALKHIDNGFYIDAGAQDPVVDSVTKAFYDRGWRGINIEPTNQYFQKLIKDRPEDINIKSVVCSKSGEALLHQFADTGMSTTSDKIANLHKSNGWKDVIDVVVPATTLEQICQEHKVDIIHFLKIDVEGDEEEVLKGFSFVKLRPWVVIVEATAPNTNDDISEKWQPYLCNNGYKFAFFDGLNKFFVSNEHEELMVAFEIPLNVIDNYTTAEVVALRKEVGEFSEKLHDSDLQNTKMQVQVSRLEAYVSEIQASLLWRIIRYIKSWRIIKFIGMILKKVR